MTGRPADLCASVVICTYASARWQALLEAVSSAARQTRPAREVVVVVDHDDALLARARMALPAALVVANHHPRGLSGARNSGVEAARGEVVAFLDDDAVAAPDWLERLLAPYGDPAVAGVGGAIVARWPAGRPAAFPEEFAWVVGCTYRGTPRSAAPVRNLLGANMSFRRELLVRAGGFDCGIGRLGTRPLGCEETELCIRLRRREPGASLHFEPSARVLHTVAPERATWRYFRDRCWAEGLSKARVVAAAGRRDGLATERSYALRTLPAGALRGLADGFHGDASGPVRAGAIAAGLAVTTAGYLAGTAGLARDGPSPSVTVVVPTCGRADQLATCLDSLLEGELSPAEVVVVDNAPEQPATARLLEGRYGEDPRVRRVVEPRRGPGHARAAGLAAAREELVAFADDDVVLDRGWLAAIAAAFAGGKDVAAVTTLILPRELETPAQRWLEQFGGFSKGFERHVFELRAPPGADRLYPYSPGIYGSGASMAFRTRTLRELGGFDRRLADGGEDLDVFLKTIVGGHRLVYEPAAIAWHRHPPTYGALRRTVFRYGRTLTALMTKWALSDPAAARAIAARLPGAVRLALDPHSRKNAGKQTSYPRALTRLERAGMAAGPPLYAAAWWRERRAGGR